METRIFSYIQTQSELRTINIFGYATKGIPGLEIKGLGKMGQTIKEKFIFMSKKRGLKIPMKRYLLCVELDDDIKLTHIEKTSFELPLLILFWTLSGMLPIFQLEGFMAKGFVDISGKIDVLAPQFHSHQKDLQMKLRPIAVGEYDECFYFDPTELFSHINNLGFSSGNLKKMIS